MKWLVLLLLLTSCRILPLTTTVSKTQNFTPKDSAVIFYSIVDPSELKQLGCIDAYGCAFGIGTKNIHIYVAQSSNKDEIKHVLEHEFNHVVYGPEHERKKL